MKIKVIFFLIIFFLINIFIDSVNKFEKVKIFYSLFTRKSELIISDKLIDLEYLSGGIDINSKNAFYGTSLTNKKKYLFTCYHQNSPESNDTVDVWYFPMANCVRLKNSKTVPSVWHFEFRNEIMTVFCLIAFLPLLLYYIYLKRKK